MSGRAWSLLAVDGDRQYAGNDGYADDPARLYSFDSNVPNGRHLRAGDIVALRNTHGLLGIAIISEVNVRDGEKLLARCPVCRTTGIKKRSKRTPAYRCNAGHEFDLPETELISVQKYEAHYGRTWIDLAGVMSAEALLSLTYRSGNMHSIRELDAPRFGERIAGLYPAARPLLAKFLQGLPPGNGLDENDGYVPSFGDRRMTIIRAIRARRGQSKFRHSLIDRYGPKCMITGCTLMEINEAAHVWPYRGDEDNAPSNGLLLRSDLHTLFDLDLIGIEPVTLIIHLAPKLKYTPYQEYDGRLLVCGASRPNVEALALRWEAFNEECARALACKLTGADEIGDAAE